MTERYTGQTVLAFLEYANEATAKISEINKLICGTEMPEDGSLLGAVYNNIYFMVEILLASIVKMDIGNDKLNNMAVELMHAKKDEIGEIIKGYGDTPI
ncbi:hypothetical protein FMM74_020305 [Lachnospiraceae bacterium MD308]|nr:hypothetical protein [Lachnospiraceae bacterium MD308]